MTTDLTGDFELGEDEFDWDVFVPDADDAELAAEAAALEDEDELNLDDSAFDWEAALHDDPESEAGADAAARAGAAYDRIVDTVRRSFEEPEAEPEPVAVTWTEAVAPIGSPPEADEFESASPVAPEPDDELDEEVWFGEIDLESDVGLSREDARHDEPAWEREWDSQSAEWTDPGLGPVEARIAEMAATVASVAPVEPFPVEPTETVPEVAQWDDGDQLDSAPSADAPPSRMSRSHKKHERRARSRVFTATVVLACLALVVMGTVAVVHARQHPAPTHITPPTATSSEISRIQAATDAVDSAATSATVGLASLPSFPTPSNVEKIVNPYVSSLQLYGNLLSGSTVPAPARSDASSAEAQVRQDLQFLDTIDTLPPLQLGAFLKQFDIDATQLQTTLSALEQNLRAPTS